MNRWALAESDLLPDTRPSSPRPFIRPTKRRIKVHHHRKAVSAIAYALFIVGCSDLGPSQAIESKSTQPTHAASFTNSLDNAQHVALVYTASTRSTKSERIERGWLFVGATPYRIVRDSDATNWMCRAAGQEDEAPDFIAYWYVTGAYDNRSKLRIWATTWRAKLYVGRGVSAVVHADDTVAACIGYNSVAVAEKNDTPDSLALLMNII
jgi:hypothetical protein